VIDWNTVSGQCGDVLALTRLLIGECVEQIGEIQTAVRQAVHAGDRRALMNAAVKAREFAGYMVALPLQSAAKRLIAVLSARAPSAVEEAAQAALLEDALRQASLELENAPPHLNPPAQGVP